MHASDWMTTRFNCSRNLPSTRSWSFFARSPEKKRVQENVSFRNVYNGQLQLCICIYSVTQNRYQTRRDTPMCFGWRKTSDIFYVLWRHPGVHTVLCTYVWPMKNFRVHSRMASYMMAYFHVSTRKISFDTSGPVSVLDWHFWSSIYSVSVTCVPLAANITSVFVNVNSSNQRFFLKFAKHAQSVRCIFCNYCANILRFCFLRCVFLVRWPIILTCGI
jgi:hypothetical protein